MKHFVVLLVAILMIVIVGTNAQPKVCDFDSTLIKDVKIMYNMLDSIQNEVLKDFIMCFTKKKNDKDSLLKKQMCILKKHHGRICKLHPPGNTETPFRCNTNKELNDYLAAINLLISQLSMLAGKSEYSSFHFSNVITAYQHLISTRSALMANMDDCIRHFSVTKENRQNFRTVLDSLIIMDEKVNIIAEKVNETENQLLKTQTELQRTKKSITKHIRNWSLACMAVTVVAVVLMHSD
jgi:hypothetical protein